jgi:glycosyltransferase involved in cell wall biosynthesis
MKNTKKTIKIAHLHWGFPPTIGGVETHLTILLPELVRRGYQVGLLTSSVEGEKTRYRYQGVEIYRTPLLDLNWLAKRGVDGLEEDIIKIYHDFIESLKPDIIHTHNMHYFSETHIRLLDEISREKGIPLILTAHNVWDNILFLRLTREINWSHIIAVSHYIKKELMGTGCDDQKITVIHHGIDTNVFHPEVNTGEAMKKHPVLKGKRVVFHPARMCLAKGCDVSIKALTIVKERFPNVVLVLAGTKNIIDWDVSQQKDIAYMLDLVRIFDLKENVYINVFSLEEMPGLYGLADVCIYPSSACEPFGLTMLESLATAKPMIVTNMGGMPEIIHDSITGYVIPVKDFEALASRTRSLLANEKLRRRLGFAGRENVRIRYTKEIMTERNLEVYRQVIAGI